MVNRQLNPNSESTDNYLKAILALGGPEEGRVSSNALARHLGVAPASVTNMLQKLAAGSPPLVEYERHRGAQLAPAGRKRALEVVRHHRLIETFLYEMLDYPIEEVHDEAERLEHFISERFEERIAAKLGHPKIDPHGHCIPAMNGRMPRPKESSRLLAKVIEKGDFLVESLSDRDPRTLKALKIKGVAPGIRIRLRERMPNSGYVISVGRSTKTFNLSEDAAQSIRVQPLNK